MTDGEKNFIESKDTLYYNVPTNCLLHGSLFLFSAVSILLYLFKADYKVFKGTFFGFVFAIIILTLDIINIFTALCFRKKYKHAYYGVCAILISLYLHFFAIKVGLYPFNQFYSLLAVGIWSIFSVSLIYAIINNVKNDRYNDDSDYIYFFKDQTERDRKYYFITKEDVSEVKGKKYGIVITWHTKISGLAYILLTAALISVFIVFYDSYNEEGVKFIQKYWQGGLIASIYLLCYITNMGWKLIIKQIYVNKALKE